MNGSYFAVLCGILLAGSTIGIIWSSVLYGTWSSPPKQYAIVIDAGSTHTDFHAYYWSVKPFNVTARVAEMADIAELQLDNICPLKNGISTYNWQPDAVGALLAQCLEAIGALIGKQTAVTPVYLRATAGMRILNLNNKTASDLILKSLNSAIQSSKYSKTFSSASILEGEYEGAFGYVTANFLDGPLNPDDTKSRTQIGALDMGGASTQISFDHVVGTPIEPANHFVATIYDRVVDIYTHSYLCFGLSESLNRYVALLVAKHPGSLILDDPCLPEGFNSTISTDLLAGDQCLWPAVPAATTYTRVGRSQDDQCKALTDELMTANVSGTVTKVQTVDFRNNSFFAFAGFNHFMDFSCKAFPMDMACIRGPNNGTKPRMSDLEALVSGLCKLTAPELAALNITPPAISALYCFQARYIKSLLSQYGFVADSNAVEFVQNVRGLDVGWTLGFVLNETNAVRPTAKSRKINGRAYGTTMAFCVIALIISSVGTFLIWRRQRRPGYASMDDL